MEASSSRNILLLVSLMSLFLHHSFSSTMVVDGVTEWRDPTAYIGDSIVFKHNDEYKVYIFQNRGAFQVCNFTQATLLTKPNSTSFTWQPSRPGIFYFSFSDGSSKPCQKGQKLAIKVSHSSTAPQEHSAISPNSSPPPHSHKIISSPPVYPWPFQPRESLSPSPAETEFLPMGPALAPGLGGGVPYINSNPVVAFPTGEVYSAAVHPIATSRAQVVVGLLASEMAFCFVTFVLLLLHYQGP